MISFIVSAKPGSRHSKLLAIDNYNSSQYLSKE